MTSRTHGFDAPISLPPSGGHLATRKPDAAVMHALRQQLDHFVDGRADGIYAVDTVGRTTLVSPAVVEMTGRAADEIIGTPIHDVLHHSHANGRHYPRETCPIYSACCHGHVEHAEDVFWRKDGTSFPIEYRTAPLVQRGEVVGGVVMFRDLDAVRRVKGQITAFAEAQVPEPTCNERSAVRLPLGQSASWERAMRLVARVARTDTTVLLTGESGTGKELVANAIHDQGPRRGRPLVKLNCAAIPATLLESELFGHERGAFTGANGMRVGRFEQAGDGTLLLDEIGELPLDAQAKLLRVLQEQEFERVGGSRTIRTHARVIAATNRDLAALVKEGRFRGDLFYRLNVFPLSLPPLRERRDDILVLARHFLESFGRRQGRRLGELTKGAERRLLEHDWPGNVRELENVMERAALLSDDDVIDEACVGFSAVAHDTASPHPVDETSPADEQSILDALARASWRITGPRGAAALLDVHPNTLRYRMKRLGLTRPV
ncbi:MAG TPA: sigma 54-interacting transcriptional regulator [Polyangiaceae bacterium]|nr:sigma 54-interacting transcriptional regulator [Polyangiaceae bacterium]